ncbi:AMP_N domain-containing protein [Mucor velutinosus]|uniref:AMP_N domain-containing protein n=1 Tax=Mucor velutinosus TaxID=708070 RepID=A0AAN7I248_9FUNG|nr:AMP_N domain-containing protein [Mucor velutinosus]
MNNITSLNEELLSLIFHNFKSIKQLSTCGLVCESWNEPAAKEMLGRTIVIKTELKAIEVYNHLIMESSKAKYTKHMHFVFNGVELPVVVEKLLRVALTPNIERISGFTEPDVFFKTIHDMINSRNFNRNKLKELPAYAGSNTSTRIRRLWLLRQSIESMAITLGDSRHDDAWKFIEQLEQCKSLNYLHMKGFLKGMNELEVILNHCPYLHALKILDFDLEGDIYHHTVSKENVDARAIAYVKQQDQLKSMSIDATCRPELLEYLIYKYVNIKSLAIQGSLWLASAKQNLQNGNLGRILDAISEIESVKLALILPAETRLKDAALFTRGRVEDIRFELEEIKGVQDIVLKAEW